MDKSPGESIYFNSGRGSFTSFVIYQDSIQKVREISMSTSQSVRVVVLNDGGQWGAQCLEHDICAMADNLDTLQSRLEVAIEAELELCKSEG